MQDTAPIHQDSEAVKIARQFSESEGEAHRLVRIVARIIAERDQFLATRKGKGS